jgi:toxin ParE1/3/4
MAAELLWSPRAEEDLLDIHAFIALDNPEAADRIVDKLHSAAALLSQHPRLCQRRPEIRPSLRLLTESPYILLYETIPDSDEGPVLRVEIVRVIDGRRDLSALL